jgi:formylglycine-generating enzyme required for sulfatase activity
LTPSRRLALLVLAPLLSTCAKDKPPTTTMGSPPVGGPDAAALPEAGAPLLDAAAATAPSPGPADGGAAGFIVFRRGSDTRDVGPEWSFETEGLPAVSKDGATVLVPRTDEQGMGGVPNLRLDVIRVSDGSVAAQTVILHRGEVIAASTADGGPGIALADLASRVAARVARANADLAAERWVPLTACSNRDPPDGVQPPCSMAEQHIACGDLRILRRGGRLDLGLDQRTATVHFLEGDVRSVPSPNGGAVPVRSCFDGAWLEPTRKLLVGRLDQECQGAGGDWCTAPSVWRVVALPFASSSTASPADAGHGCREGMVTLSGGSFDMGDPEGLSYERTVHRETVAPFCMDATEVTVASYAACVDKKRCSARSSDSAGNDVYCGWKKAGSADRPINCVAWADADDYCRWAGKRLPTEMEWEYAARGSEGRAYPWGSTPPSTYICWNRERNAKGFPADYVDAICAAGTSPGDRTPQGIADLGGNVSEWTATLSRDRGVAPGAHVIRGGAWSSSDTRFVRAAHRQAEPSAVRHDSLGFRCATDSR